MKKKNVVFIIFFLIILIFLYFKYSEQEKVVEIKKKNIDDRSYRSNIVEDVYYSTKDINGNEYIITASIGEIDYKQNDVIFLTDVRALVKLNMNDIIEISSKHGKYNSSNSDTIFSKNVIISYLKNKISGEYVDFSMERNSMIISKKVVYTNFENILEADVIEINIKTKDTKIFMHSNEKKVSIKNK